MSDFTITGGTVIPTESPTGQPKRTETVQNNGSIFDKCVTSKGINPDTDYARLVKTYGDGREPEGWLEALSGGLKNLFGTENSSNKVDEAVCKQPSSPEEYKQLQQKVADYENSQASSVKTGSNFLSTLAGIATAGGSMAISATVGAAAKLAAVKSNMVAGQEYSGTDMLLDAYDGAFGGVAGQSFSTTFLKGNPAEFVKNEISDEIKSTARQEAFKKVASSEELQEKIASYLL